jgi:hypothetical protein
LRSEASMTNAAAHHPMFHSTLMRKAGAAHDERPGTPGYYAFTTGFDAAGVEHVFLQQPPATADLARSLRLIFCISKYLLSGYQIRPRTKPRFVELREYYHRDLFRGDYLRFFTLLLYIHQDFSAIIIFSISREHRHPSNFTATPFHTVQSTPHTRQVTWLPAPFIRSPAPANSLHLYKCNHQFIPTTKINYLKYAFSQ